MCRWRSLSADNLEPRSQAGAQGDSPHTIGRGPWNVTAALAGAVFYAVLAGLDAPTGFRQVAAFAMVVAMRLAFLSLRPVGRERDGPAYPGVHR